MWKTAIVLLYLLILGIMDIREKKVPAVLLVLGILLALTVGAGERMGSGVGWGRAVHELLLGMMPGGFLLAAAYVTGKAGLGDGLVLIALGIIHGYLAGIILFCVSLFLLFLFSIGLLLLKKANGSTCIPYLPFLAAAYAICVYNFRGNF